MTKDNGQRTKNNLNSSLKLGSFPLRVLLLLPAILLIGGAVLAVRWGLANSLAEQAQFKEVAQLAVEFSPADPQAHFTLARLNEKSFLPDDLTRAAAGYERAAALAPFDFRLWLTLGRMRERAGDAEGAERCVRRAAELAPNYAQIRWTLGNILLRRGKRDEAFAEFKKAGELNPGSFAAPVADAVLQTFGADDLNLIREKVGGAPAIQAALVSFLAKDGKFDLALRLWNDLPEAERGNFRDNGNELLKSLLAAKRFRTALPLYAASAEGNVKPTLGQLTNGGFETDIGVQSGDNPFVWQIADGGQPQIALDGLQKRGGARSLVLIFNSVSGQDFRAVAQSIAVESGARYRLEFYARTAGFKTTGTARWEISDAENGQVLAASPVLPSEADWQPFAVDFAAPPRAEAVTIRLARAPCNVPPCSLIGKMWFDDFNLQKIEDRR